MMIEEFIEDRKDLIDATKKEDERSDLKQHADKMLRDFENFTDTSANRAIWELVQNACDLTEDCEVLIDYRNDKIVFTHNGKPFDTKSLISLIKQVSGKYGEEKKIKEVGKYGTGFLTTHSFGRKFRLDSFLDTKSYILPINNFLIDRSPKTWEILSDNIAEQKARVYKLLREEEPIKVSEFTTTFTYLPQTPKEFEYITKSSNDLELYLPLIFTVNDRLKKVTIINNVGQSNTFYFNEKKKIENEKNIKLYETVIKNNDDSFSVFSLIDEENEIEILLPINKNKVLFEFEEQIARLFLYYPLIGSEDFGFNFIINCKNFLPTEPRDGIHLNSDKDQIQDQEEMNKIILEKSTDIIFEFLESNVLDVPNPLLYSNVHFKIDNDDALLNEYFGELQNSWNKRLEVLNLVKTSEGLKKINEVYYFAEDLIVDDVELLDVFYQLVSKFYKNIPVKEDVINWSKNANKWNNDSVQFIDNQILIEKIASCQLSDFDSKTLVKYYHFLLENTIYSSAFNDHTLLPNIDGGFHKLGYFLSADNLNGKLVDLGKVLIPLKVSQLIHEDYKFSFEFTPFNQRNFSDEVKNILDEKEYNSVIYLTEETNNENYIQDLVSLQEKVDVNYFKALFEVCKLSYSKDANNKPIQLVKIIADYYGFDDELIKIPNVSVEGEKIELRAIRKILFEIFFNLLKLHTNDWVKSNLELLLKIHLQFDDSNKEVFRGSKIYPNQLYEMCSRDILKRDINITENIKLLYLQIAGRDINENLSVKDFNHFIDSDNFIDDRYLATEMEEKIFLQDINTIEEHKYRDQILSIIPKLNDVFYQNLFPRINDKKAQIMISVVTKDDIKDDIFAIVTLSDDKLKDLGKLIANPDFEKILSNAMDEVEREKEEKGNFQFKHKIGTHIEELLRIHLKDIYSPEIIKYESLNVQDGQDIIIKINGNAVYFIEVKSRWDSKSSIKMSKNQTIKSNEEKQRYSLCSVDMTSYFEDDRYEISDLNKVRDKVRFVKGIGGMVEHLVDVLNQTNEKDEIHLDGDYRTLVPQDVIENSGISFGEFEEHLVNLLKKS